MAELIPKTLMPAPRSILAAFTRIDKASAWSEEDGVPSPGMAG